MAWLHKQRFKRITHTYYMSTGRACTIGNLRAKLKICNLSGHLYKQSSDRTQSSGHVC